MCSAEVVTRSCLERPAGVGPAEGLGEDTVEVLDELEHARPQVLDRGEAGASEKAAGLCLWASRRWSPTASRCQIPTEVHRQLPGPDFHRLVTCAFARRTEPRPEYADSTTVGVRSERVRPEAPADVRRERKSRHDLRFCSPASQAGRAAGPAWVAHVRIGLHGDARGSVDWLAMGKSCEKPKVMTARPLRSRVCLGPPAGPARSARRR
jgi:hypothetical protein